MLSVTHLHKIFGKKRAVDDVNFSIESGKIFALIGPNGSGKTTIVKIITGLLTPTSGTVRIDGHDVARDPIGAKSRVGYIPDEPAVWPTMTGEEFLHLTGALFGMSVHEREARVKELLPLFHLNGLEKELFGSYSRGSRQKFSILAALLHKPKLLVVDEPIVGLDPQSATVAKGLFRTFARGGGSVLLVTHTLSAAEELADQVGVLKNSRLIATGTLNEVREQVHVAGASLEQVYDALIS